ncbi:MAG: glycosyltransferase [Acidobacteriota bacterium]|nr:glycosyltransferase [Acidobacteriota bacterium]
MKTLAFIIPSVAGGGMERVMSHLISYIAVNKDCECHLILYGKSREIFYNIPKQVFIHKPNFNFNDRYRTFFTFRTMLYLRETVKKVHPFSILSFGELWNSLVLLSLLGLKFPIYISDRSCPNKSFGYFHDLIRKILYPKASTIIVQTNIAKRIYASKFKQKNISVIGNPLKIHNEINMNKRQNIVISIGRLIDTKHFDRLINIFYSINLKDWKLIIIGGDSNKQNNSTKLQAQIENIGMENRILLAGKQKNIENILLKAKIFAFTSSSEGFPNVIGEAMSAGLPVVAYDCVAGPSEIIEDGKNGFLIPLFDDKMFEEKLKFLMSHEEETKIMGDYARESIKRFSVELIAEKFYKTLTSS